LIKILRILKLVLDKVINIVYYNMCGGQIATRIIDSEVYIMRDIYKEVEYCTDLLSVLYDVPQITEIKVSKRMKNKFGMCSTKRSDDSFIRLTFASFILDDNYPKEAFYNTVVHELLHEIDHNKTTANGGHGGRWLEMAREVSDCLPFGDITRFASASKVKARNEVMPKKKYEVVCPNCHCLCGRGYGYRAPKWYAHPDKYKCTVCGHHGLVRG
jgi:predicted SprT family Zn-dependent metalloprotease